MAISTPSSTVTVAGLTEIRAREPQRIGKAWQARTRRDLVGEDGRLLIVAADHPARGALGVRGDGSAMASRSDLLDRLATAISRPGVDGVLGRVSSSTTGSPPTARPTSRPTASTAARC